MKKKLQFLCSVVALMLVSFVAKAQNPGDDVTATYITNWDFTGCSNGNFPGWVISAPSGGNTWVHGSTAVEYWNNNLSANFDYYQVVTVPAGKYKLSASMWNTQGTVTGESGVYGTSSGVTVFAGVTDDCGDADLHTYTTDEIVVIDGTLRVGVKNNAARKANWFGIDWIKLTYVDALQASDYANVLATVVASANAVNEADVPASVYSALQTAVSENNKTYETAEEYQAAIAAINAAVNKANLYAAASAYFAKMGAVLENTNVYSEEAYNAVYSTWLANYEAGTLDNEVLASLNADKAYSNGWHSSNNIDDILLSTWTIGSDQAKDYDKALYINTWSVEGDTDGTEFKVPFFEYWIEDTKSLGENTLTATLENVAPGSYEVSAWVRVRAKNGAAATDATGITLSANDGEAVDVTEGEAVGTSQFNIGKYTASATVGDDGILKIKFNVAADNNISWLSFKDVKYAAVAEPATAIVNAEFNPEADPLGWEKVNPEQYYDLGMGLIGTYQVRGEHPAATVDETHPATEYAAGLECRWQTNYAAFTQTTANLPAGYYKLTFDVENTNASTTSAAYENRFTVTVGENVYTDESTEWMNGKSAWTTHTIAFPVEEAAPITISLGYGTGTNNYGVGNTPNLFVSNLQLTTADPVVEAKAKALAKIAALAPVGDALFQYAQADIEAAKADVEAATTVAEVEAVAMPAPNAPDAEKQYAFQLKLDGETPLYMNLTETGITIAEEATPLSFVETETAGQYNLVADGLYVGLAGGNAWTMSTAADNKAAWTFTALGNDEYYINNLVTAGRFVGTNAADKAAGNSCYADKQTSNGNVVWIITEYVAPTPEPINMTDLTPAMFHKWTLVEPIEVSVENQPCANGLYKQDGSVYGDMSVNPDQYADLSEWDYLTIAATGGVPRLIFNRTADLTQEEGSEAWKGTIPLQIQDTESEYLVSKDNDIYVYDLKAIKEFLGGTVHLNAIKVAGGGQMTTHAIKLSTIQPCIPTWYTITSADGIENGTVSAWEKTVEGAPVKVTATPAEGYELEGIAYAIEGEEEGEEAENGTFTMPAANVIIAASFKKAPEYIISDLTKEMFHVWTTPDAEAVVTETSASCDYVVGEETTMPYGNGSVLALQYADLSEYDILTIETTSGEPRLCLNRPTDDEQTNYVNIPNNAEQAAKYIKSKTDNKFVYDLKAIKTDYEFVHLNCIKAAGAWGSKVTVTSMKLGKLAEEAHTLYAITVLENENGTVETDVTEAEEGATVTITVTPNDGFMVDEASYSYTLDGEAEPTVAEIAEPEEGNAATITMPAADVTVNITFKAIEVEPETPTIAATLVHTAASFCGDPADVFTSTVDAEAEHVNNSNFGAKWAGAAYADFSLATLPAGATITKATLTFTGIGESRNARNTNVQYVNQDLTLDYTALSAGNANVNLAATDITSVSFPKYTEETKSQEFKIDVTDFVKDIAAKQNYIIFKWTGNQGGGDVAGKASENAPTLVIEYIPGAPEIANASFEEDGEKAASNGALELTGWTFGGVGTQFNNTELRPAESESTTSQFGTSAPSDGEYSLFFRQGWNGGGNTITLTSDALAEIPAGDYVLSVDYKQHYSHDGSANENTKVGIALVNGENTIGSEVSPAATGVNGGSADATYFNDTEWSTLEASFSITEAIPAGAQVVITLYSAGQRRSDFFLDNVQFTKVPGIEIALIDLKKAIEAAEAKKATYGIGEGLFQYPESEIEPLAQAITTAQAAYNAAESKAAVEAATAAINGAVEAFAPAMTAPDPEKKYILTLQTSDEASPFELSVSTEGIKIVATEEGTPITFVAQEGGSYALSNGTEYLNYKPDGNKWDLAATTDAYGWTIAALPDGGYSITGKNGLFGTNTSNGNAVNSPCYGDKNTGNGNYIWNITEYVEPTEKTIEIAFERMVNKGYIADEVSYTESEEEILEFLGVATWEDIEAMYPVVMTTGVAGTDNDGWRDVNGDPAVWSNEGTGLGLCLKYPHDGSFALCTHPGNEPAEGAVLSAAWMLGANGKTVTVKVNVTFVEVPAPELAISDVKVKKDVIYDNTVTSNYAEQIAELTDEEVQSILTELNLTSLDEAKVYGYNPSDESFVVAYAGFDGWRDANGDFAMHTGTTDVPACCKYTDGKSYYCYNIAGVGDKIVKTYWAISNDEKAVLVEVDFWFGDAYTGIDGIASDGKAKANGKYLENGKVVIYRNGQKFSTTGVQLK